MYDGELEFSASLLQKSPEIILECSFGAQESFTFLFYFYFFIYNNVFKVTFDEFYASLHNKNNN